MDHARLYPPLSASGWHRAGGGRRANRTGAARFCQGLGTSLTVESRTRRQAHGDALEALRSCRGRCLQRHGRGFQDRHRHRDERIQRVVRGRAAEGLRGCQHRAGSRPRLGPAHAAAAISDQSAENERRRRLSRQEVRRLDRRGRCHLQAGQRLAWHSRGYHRRLHDLSQIGRRKSWIQGLPQGLPGLSSNCAKRSRRTTRRPASRSATPRAMPTVGCTGCCGVTAPTRSTRTTR